jgi:hypothetical protein
MVAKDGDVIVEALGSIDDERSLGDGDFRAVNGQPDEISHEC